MIPVNSDKIQYFLKSLLDSDNKRKDLLSQLPEFHTWTEDQRSLYYENHLLKKGPWTLETLDNPIIDDNWLRELLHRLLFSLEKSGKPGEEQLSLSIEQINKQNTFTPENTKIILNLFCAIAFRENSITRLKEYSLPFSTRKKWTIVVYSNQFDSDVFSINDLKMAERNINENTINIIYLIRRVDGRNVENEWKRSHWVSRADGNWSGLRTYSIRRSNTPYYAISSQLLREEPDKDLDDTRYLGDFLEWATKNFPADKYCLSVWNHGSHIKGPTFIEDSTLPVSVDKLGNNVRSAWKKAVGPDNRKIDLLIFNGCNLASVEIMTEFSDIADFCFAAQTRHNVPGDGWLYKTLSETPDLPVRDLLESYLDNYVDTGQKCYKRNSIETAFSATVLDLRKLPALLEKITDLSNAIMEDPPGDKIFENLEPAEEKPFSWFEFDLQDVIGRMALLPDKIGIIAGEIIEILKDKDMRPVIRHFHNEIIPHLNGLNIYLKTRSTIKTLNEINRETGRNTWSDSDMAKLAENFLTHPYTRTLFARKTGWDKALDAIMNRVNEGMG